MIIWIERMKKRGFIDFFLIKDKFFFIMDYIVLFITVFVYFFRYIFLFRFLIN